MADEKETPHIYGTPVTAAPQNTKELFKHSSERFDALESAVMALSEANTDLQARVAKLETAASTPVLPPPSDSEPPTAS